MGARGKRYGSWKIRPCCSPFPPPNIYQHETIPVCLFFQAGFSAADSVTNLKLIEAGVPKENLALLAIPMVPIQILLPLYISRYTAGT